MTVLGMISRREKISAGTYFRAVKPSGLNAAKFQSMHSWRGRVSSGSRSIASISLRRGRRLILPIKWPLPEAGHFTVGLWSPRRQPPQTAGK